MPGAHSFARCRGGPCVGWTLAQRAGCHRLLYCIAFGPSLRARHCSRALVALHVPLCKDGRECKNCLERLRFLAPLNESHTVPVEHIVQSGDTAALIAEYARLFGVDLVVLGSPENELAEE